MPDSKPDFVYSRPHHRHQMYRGFSTSWVAVTALILVAIVGLWAYARAPESARTSVVLAVVVSCAACAVMGRETRHHGRILMPGVLFGYLQAISLVIGLVAYLSLRGSTIGVSSTALAFTANAHTLALTAFLTVYLIPGRDTTVSRWRSEPSGNVVMAPSGSLYMLILAALGAAGVYMVTIRGLDLQLLLTNPAEARSATQFVSPTGISWLLYKLLIPFAALAIALKGRKTGAKWMGVAVVLTFIAYLAYGGRLQALLLLLVVAVSYDSLVKRIPPSRVIGAVGLLTLLAVLFAGYRYFSLYGQQLDGRRIEATIVRQFSGTVAELGDTRALVVAPDARSRDVLVYEIYVKTVPSIARGEVARPQAAGSFGEYVAKVQRRTDAGGLRVGPIGEWSLGFGLPTALLVGLAIAVCCRALDRLVASRNAVPVVVGVIGLSQLIFVFVTGSANTMSSLAVVAVTAVFALMILAGPLPEPAEKDIHKRLRR